MGHFWTFLTHVHTLAGPVLTLLYPLYASVIAIESTSKLDDEQWLAYWILYSFLTLAEMVLQSLLEWNGPLRPSGIDPWVRAVQLQIPIWYTVKLALVAWLVLPQFRGAAFIYQRYVREEIRKRGLLGTHLHNKSPNGRAKN